MISTRPSMERIEKPLVAGRGDDGGADVAVAVADADADVAGASPLSAERASGNPDSKGRRIKINQRRVESPRPAFLGCWQVIKPP